LIADPFDFSTHQRSFEMLELADFQDFFCWDYTSTNFADDNPLSFPSFRTPFRRWGMKLDIFQEAFIQVRSCFTSQFGEYFTRSYSPFILGVCFQEYW